MRDKRQVVLIFGAVAMLLVLLTTESHQYPGDGIVLHSNAINNLANVWDWKSGLTKSVIVALATVAAYLAAGDQKKRE